MWEVIEMTEDDADTVMMFEVTNRSIIKEDYHG